MKIRRPLVYCIFLLFGGMFLVVAQTAKKKDIKVQKRTLMGQFEPDMVKPVEERIALKERRITHQRITKRILDTLDISDRKRRKLMRELRKSPFSGRIAKTILAGTEFEEDLKD